MSEMRIVWKYTLGQSKYIDIPENPKFLKIDVQNGEAVMWALVDPENKKQAYRVAFTLTGWPVKDTDVEGSDYTGTTEINGLVRHWFISLAEEDQK